ncbi:hypothetical protein CERSUDRAFT_98699 [Gelatoporia subvermispora B]|uniref:Uncharacterized protein n=1 Tax=Ceriporiopsis subvermispora (strain B) TaxID=914234 RepID=M2R2G8_CERS8|nr:hypothetical protein CERSUDRAFT_98699 [Gelatoporia subvermispora B]
MHPAPPRLPAPYSPRGAAHALPQRAAQHRGWRRCSWTDTARARPSCECVQSPGRGDRQRGTRTSACVFAPACNARPLRRATVAPSIRTPPAAQRPAIKAAVCCTIEHGRPLARGPPLRPARARHVVCALATRCVPSLERTARARAGGSRRTAPPPPRPHSMAAPACAGSVLWPSSLVVRPCQRSAHPEWAYLLAARPVPPVSPLCTRPKELTRAVRGLAAPGPVLACRGGSELAGREAVAGQLGAFAGIRAVDKRRTAARTR